VINEYHSHNQRLQQDTTTIDKKGIKTLNTVKQKTELLNYNLKY